MQINNSYKIIADNEQWFILFFFLNWNATLALTYIVFFIVQGLIIGSFSGWLALNKDRSVGTWFFLGFWFSFVALIAIAAAPKTLLDPPER